MPQWQTMTHTSTVPMPEERREELTRWAEAQGYNQDQIAAVFLTTANAQTYANDLYVATVQDWPSRFPGWPDMIHVSIRRKDRAAIHDWRHLQQIKNDLFGDEAEAVELYPAESRVVDTANSYHLFVLAQRGITFPFGWEVGLRADQPIAGNNQRPRA